MSHQITHIVFDAARIGERIDEAKAFKEPYDSLYRGDSEESLSDVAPYLFQFTSLPFSNWYFEKGWGDSWGVLLKSSRPMPELHKHFRKFLLVKTEDDQELYFRFYDPRVLRIFLLTCDKDEVRAFFGPIDYFIMEDEDPAYALRFWHENGSLKKQQLKLEEIVGTSSGIFSEDSIQSLQLSDTTPDKTNLSSIKSAQHTTQQKVPDPVNEAQPAIAKPKSKWNLFD